MSFFGKEYKYEKEENFADFLKGVGFCPSLDDSYSEECDSPEYLYATEASLPDEEVEKYLQYTPSTKIEKDGDEYVVTTTSASGTKTTKFTSGVEFEDQLKEGFPVKTTYTVDGNTVTQVLNTDKGSATFVREFNDDELVVTITSSVWDGTAKRYYKA